MDLIEVNAIERINGNHIQAQSSARDAMECAMEAGRLLLLLKNRLPYGDFGEWIEANLSVSIRQCQRYMALYLDHGDSPTNIAGSGDMMSQLTASSLLDSDGEEVNHHWIPEPGCWYTTVTGAGSYWVVPDTIDPDQFHISRFYSDDYGRDRFVGSRWPVAAKRVQAQLIHFQLAAPYDAIWRKRAREGLQMPFGAPAAHGKIRLKGKDGEEVWVKDAP